MFPSIVYGDKKKTQFDELWDNMTPQEKFKIRNYSFDEILNNPIGTLCSPEGEKVGMMKTISKTNLIDSYVNKKHTYNYGIICEENYDGMPGLISVCDMDYNKDNGNFTVRIEI